MLVLNLKLETNEWESGFDVTFSNFTIQFVKKASF